MLPFTAVSHVSVTVTDLEQARHFYGTVVGLREISRPAFQFPGVWYDLGGELSLHVSVKDAPSPRAMTSGPFDTRDPHFALAVADADDLHARLERTGRPFHDFVQTPTGLRQLFVRDPDGNMIEFIGPTRERRVRRATSDSSGEAADPARGR